MLVPLYNTTVAHSTNSTLWIRVFSIILDATVVSNEAVEFIATFLNDSHSKESNAA